MDSIEVVSAVLLLLAGIGVFLVSCSMLSSYLESMSGSKLRKLFSKASDSKLLGVGIGAVSTAAIQSSGATTVLVIGFVNAGVMALPLAATIIYGANIGTTITAQIVALGMFGDNTLSLTAVFSALAGIGAFFMLFAKKDRTKKIGGILAGFGMLFVGLTLMSSSMEGFAQMPELRNFLASIDNILILLIVGVVVTAIVQSSSVTTTVAITMVVAGLIDLNQGIYLTLGSNIGSCVVAILAGMTGSLNSKRTALIHLLFNVFGVVIFVIAGFVMGMFGLSFAGIFESCFPGIPQTQMAMFHTFFNVVTVIIMLPLTNKLVAIVTRILPEKEASKEEDADEPHFHFINNYLLKTPPLAVEQVRNEVVNMAGIAMENFSLACDMILTKDFTEFERFKRNENELNFLNKNVGKFVVKLSDNQLSERDHVYLSTVLHSLTDMERIGDYAYNIVEYAQKMQEMHESFSEHACKEVRECEALVRELYELIVKAYAEKDEQALRDAYEVEENIDIMTSNMAEGHIRRLSEGICSLDVGAEYLSLASDAERVADHFINMGKTIRQLV